MSLCECGCGQDAGAYASRKVSRRFIPRHQAKLASAISHAQPKIHKTHCPRGHEKNSENTNTSGACKACAKIRAQERRLPDHCIHGHLKCPENTTENGACKLCKEKHLQQRYGISLDNFYSLLKRQDGRCAICHVLFSKQCKPRVDHKHDNSANARGLLCHGCNVGLGSFKESAESLMSAAKYIKETQWNHSFTVSFSATDLGLEAARILQSQQSLPSEDIYMTFAATASQVS